MLHKRFTVILIPLAALFLLPLAVTPVLAMGISFDVTSGGILEDAILIATIAGDPPRDAVILGDLDLSLTEQVFSVTVDPTTTDWWLIGHQAGDVVYSSNQNLEGVDMYDIDPYIGAELAWNIPANLDGYVNGTGYSMDWWAQTVSNHHDHVAADGMTSHLWRFASPGTGIGQIAVSLHTDTPPPIGGQVPPIPEPASLALFGLGALALAIFRKRRP